MQKKLIIPVVVAVIGLTGAAVAITPPKPKPVAISVAKVTKPVQVKATQADPTITQAPQAPAVSTPVAATAPAPPAVPSAYETQMKLQCMNERVKEMASIQSDENEITSEIQSLPDNPADFNSQLATLQNRYTVVEARTC